MGAPFLDSHCSYGCENVLGSVVPDTARIEDGKGIATVLLSRAPGASDTVQKIREGVIRNVSVGYWIHKIVKTEADDGKVARWDVVDWEPLEISAVPIPADPGSQIRSAEQQQDGKGPTLRSCVVVTQPPASEPKKARTQETSMATRTTAKNAGKRGTKVPAEMTEDEKRLATLKAAERAAARAGKRDDDEDDKDKEDESGDERDGDDEDDKSKDERDGDGADDEDGDEDDKSKDERDGDDPDEEDDAEDEDEKRAAAGKRKDLSAADVRKAAEKAVRADRLRGAKIREIGAQFGFPKLAERHANGETSVRDFKDLVLERLAARQKKSGSTLSAAPTRELDESARAGTLTARDYEKGAQEARALLGKTA